MRDQRLPDAATDGARTLDTTPERDEGGPDPRPAPPQDRDGAPTDRAQARPDPAATDPGGR